MRRPLERIADSGGAFITRGVSVDSLDRKKLWDTHITVKPGECGAGRNDHCGSSGDLGYCPQMYGAAECGRNGGGNCPDGQYTIDDTIVTLELRDGSKKELSMTQQWPIRVPRPVNHRYSASVPLVTGQRILDTMFPIAKGGTAAIPGGFGTGKTMTQHQIAKWSDADIIVYIGCGERGNEMTQVLEEFGELVDPRNGNPLMDRTSADRQYL